MSSSDQPLARYEVNPSIDAVYLDSEGHLKHPIPQNPITRPANETWPLAASARPAGFYSQHQCAICNDPIAVKKDADFIGHGPCRHRGTCIKPKCIHAYYGTERKWASPYRGEKPLYCQVLGCGRKIEGWCHYNPRMGSGGEMVLAVYQRDPDFANAAFERGKDKQNDTGGHDEEDQQETQVQKQKQRGESLGEVTGSKVGDFCMMVAVVICCGCRALSY